MYDLRRYNSPKSFFTNSSGPLKSPLLFLVKVLLFTHSFVQFTNNNNHLGTILYSALSIVLTEMSKTTVFNKFTVF